MAGNELDISPYGLFQQAQDAALWAILWQGFHGNREILRQLENHPCLCLCF
jgi:hypothetical protein